METPQANSEWVRHLMALRHSLLTYSPSSTANSSRSTPPPAASRDWLRDQHAALARRTVPVTLKCVLAASGVSKRFAACAADFKKPEYKVRFWDWSMTFIALLDFRIRHRHIDVFHSTSLSASSASAAAPLRRFLVAAREHLDTNALSPDKENLLRAMGVRFDDIPDTHAADDAHNIALNKSTQKHTHSPAQRSDELEPHVNDENDEDAVNIIADWEPPRRKPSKTLRSLEQQKQALAEQLQKEEAEAALIEQRERLRRQQQQNSNGKRKRKSGTKPKRRYNSRDIEFDGEIVDYKENENMAEQSGAVLFSSWAASFVRLRRYFRHRQRYNIPPNERKLLEWKATETARYAAGALPSVCAGVLRTARVVEDDEPSPPWCTSFVQLVDFLLSSAVNVKPVALLDHSCRKLLDGRVKQSGEVATFMAACERDHAAELLHPVKNALLCGIDVQWHSHKFTKICIMKVNELKKHDDDQQQHVVDDDERPVLVPSVPRNDTRRRTKGKRKLDIGSDNPDHDQRVDMGQWMRRFKQDAHEPAVRQQPPPSPPHRQVVDDDEGTIVIEVDEDEDDAQLHSRPAKRRRGSGNGDKCEKMVSSMIKGMVGEVITGRQRTADELEAEDWVESVGVEALDEFADRWARSNCI